VQDSIDLRKNCQEFQDFEFCARFFSIIDIIKPPSWIFLEKVKKNLNKPQQTLEPNFYSAKKNKKLTRNLLNKKSDLCL